MNNEEKIAAVEDALDCGHPELIAQTTRAGQGGRLAGKSNRRMDCAPEVRTGQGAAMTPEQYAQLEKTVQLVRDCDREALPKIVGLLRELLATAELRLNAPASNPARAEDTYLTARQAAERLHCTKDYLYKKSWPFARKLGGKTLFSARGIEQYLQQKS